MTSKDVPAHSQGETHHYIMHFPPHPARENDPHYVDFHHYHTTHRAGARCFIGERIGFGDCMDDQTQPCPPPPDGGEQPGLELHHAHVEFSLQNGVSLTALEKDYPGISDPAAVGEWVESEPNFRWLCCAEGTLIQRPGGPARPIETLRLGDRVLGSDGLPHKVTAIKSRDHAGAAYTIPGGPTLTGEHPVLTPEGWRPVSSLTPHDLIYRVPEYPQGTRAADQVDIGEVHNRPSRSGKGDVPGPVVLDLIPVPLHPIYLDDDLVGRKHRVRYVAADGAERFVGHPGSVQCFEQPAFKSRWAVPDRSPLPVVVVVPHAQPGAVEAPVVSVAVGLRAGCREVFSAGPAVRCAGGRSGQGVQRRYPARVRAELAGAHALDVGAVQPEQLPASLASQVEHASVVGLLATGRGAGTRAGRVPVGDVPCDQEAAAAGHAHPFHARPSAGRWSPVGEIDRSFRHTKVYDITVADSHDFIADGVLVHNCAWHHRGAAGAHTASHSDWEAGQYILGLISRAGGPA